jgi:hypothetical protein
LHPTYNHSITFCSLTEDEQELLEVYHKILTAIPTLESQLRYAVEHRSSGLVDLATYVCSSCLCLRSFIHPFKIEAMGNKGCSDNCSSLCNNAIDYVPHIEDVPHIDRKAKKEQRGFCHFTTAHLLCPRPLRDDFDADMEGFCRSVQNGTLVITHDDWPSFLYPENMYNPDALDEHLMHGAFLLLVCLCHLFIYMLNLSLVLSTSLHWPAHWFEDYTWKGTWQEMPCQFVQDAQSPS